ncbi:MAG: hypothetical protein HGA78_12105 [Nitrospirales bacterium]|nr:hypothetical protein [Nitrospirales bacterium]
MSDIGRFSLLVLAKWSDRSRNCLNPQGEFCGCSAMSLQQQKNERSSECLLFHLPFLGSFIFQ